MTTKTHIIIYLFKDKFQLYAPSLPTLLEFHFVPTIIRDLDIIDQKLFDELIGVFLTTNKVPQGEIIIIIGESASFIKNFQGTDQETIQKQAKEFITHVPFDNVAGTTFPIINGIQAYATNKELYESLSKILEKYGFMVIAVFPGLAFGDAVSTKKTLDAQMITAVLQQINNRQDYNFLGIRSTPVMHKNPKQENEKLPPVEQQENHLQKKTNKNRLLMLLIIFGLLILLLLVVIIVNRPF